MLLRWVILAAWVVGTAAAFHWLPSYSAAETSGGMTDLAPANSTPVKTELGAIKTFGFPLLSEDVLVQHRADGLSAAATKRVVERADHLSNHQIAGAGSVAAAVPILDAGRVVPSSRHPGTTALTFLYFKPSVSTTTQLSTIHHLARADISRPGDSYVGATGAFVAETVQGNDISGSLSTVELAAIAVVFLVVAIAFRSLVAPLVALAAVGVAYLVSARVLAEIALRLGFSLPGQLEPLIVILVVGIVTDYTIFFLSAQQTALAGGRPPREAARRSVGLVLPLVAVAGITVAAGTATLSVARLSLYGALGPGMAIAAVVSAVTAITLVPALVAVVGRRLLWPHDPTKPPRQRRVSTAVTRFQTRRWVAAATVVLAAAGLAIAAGQASRIHFGLNLVSDLPPSSAPARASAAAAQGFAPGIVSPTMLVIHHPGLDHHSKRLVALEHQLAGQPGVAGVIGPGDVPPDLRARVFVAPRGGAARYLLILDRDPMGAQAVSILRHVESSLPSLLRADRLGGPVGVAGDTAVAATLASQTRSAVLHVGVALLLVDLIMLVLLLRCLVAPVFLLAGSVLSVLAALGLTAVAFPSAATLGMTFYVPMAIGVLLMSFGADYNIFLVGRIWEEAGPHRLDRAIVAAVPQASSTITRAGAALGLTFALLALVPLESFRTFAFGMVVGVVIDTFVVRSLVVPALLSLLREFAGWPSRRLMRRLATSG